MHIDKRIRYLIVLDTETTNGLIGEDGKPDLSNSLAYDVGWAVTDKRGIVYKTRSFVVKEIFCDRPELMQSAYYADKIPRYVKDIVAGTRTIASWYEIREALLADMQEYNSNVVIAHNAYFDDNVLKVTQRYLTKSKYRYFLPPNVEVWDSMKMALDTIAKQKTYIKFCQDNGYMTKHKVPRPRVTAEVLYRYFTFDTDYQEEHTALEDVMIEKEIVARCFKTHKKMRKKLYED